MCFLSAAKEPSDTSLAGGTSVFFNGRLKPSLRDLRLISHLMCNSTSLQRILLWLTKYLVCIFQFEKTDHEIKNFCYPIHSSTTQE